MWGVFGLVAVPRGLASAVFALIAVETLEVDDGPHAALSIVTLTVALSVLAHGISAAPLAEMYGRWVGTERPSLETGGSDDDRYTPQPRGSILRGTDPSD